MSNEIKRIPREEMEKRAEEKRRASISMLSILIREMPDEACKILAKKHPEKFRRVCVEMNVGAA